MWDRDPEAASDHLLFLILYDTHSVIYNNGYINTIYLIAGM